MFLRQIFDPYLAQYSYLIGCQQTGEALLIDPERDVDRYRTLASQNGLRISAVAETHIHADFISGAREFAQEPSIQLYLSDEGGEEWRYTWAFGRERTTFLRDGGRFSIGKIEVTALHTPGHTPEHLSFTLIDKGGGADKPMALLSGDFLFVGDVGRPDLLETAAGQMDSMRPAAQKLRSSLHKLSVSFEDYVQVFPGHGAGSACGKSLGAVPSSTIGYEKKFNRPLKLATSDQDAFIDDILHGQPEPPLYFATMKRLNRDGAPVTGGIPAVPHVTPQEFVELTSRSGRSAVAIDVREDRIAFDNAHFPSSLNAPLRSSFFTSVVGSYVGENEPVVLILEESADLDLAVRQLYRIGFDAILGWVNFDDLKSANLLSSTITRLRFSDFNPEEAREEGLILDVRSMAEYERSHLTGALSLAYTRIRDRRDELPHNKRLYVHCGTGKRAGFACSFLQAQGYEVVHVDGVYYPETRR